MKILTVHADYLEYEPKQKAIRTAEEIEKKKYQVNECLVVFIAVEKKDSDTKKSSLKLSQEIKDIANQVKAKKIVLYPYAHLSSDLGSADKALEILKETEKILKKDYEIIRPPFGWYKSFVLSCKGHPLSELSREFSSEETVKEEIVPKKIKKTYKIFTPDGKLFDPEDYQYKKDEEDFKILVEKEALGKESPGGSEPEYIKYCKRFGIDWEKMSDSGHMRFDPIGTLIFDLIAEYSKKITEDLGIPIYSIRGTNLFNLNEKAVREHAELFGDRLYEVRHSNKRFVMRYASCHQQFALMKDWNISYKNLPFGVFEIADSYRLEQSGELLLCYRPRRFNMPDLHVVCKDLKDSESWFYVLHKKIYEEIKKIKRDFVSLYNLTSEEFFEKNKEWFIKLAKLEKKPILLCFYPEGVNYYWVLNVEYHVIDKMKRAREIATVQTDVGNAERFNIRYTDEKGGYRYPVILHTAIIGSIERYLYTLFDTALRYQNPTFPLWLSPTQVRLCPVNDSLIPFCEKIANELEKENIRIDIDDRSESIQKKIRDSEMEWIPFIVVIGDKERKGDLPVRIRAKKDKVIKMSKKQLISLIKKETKDKPFKKLPLPRLVSKRVKFVG